MKKTVSKSDVLAKARKAVADSGLTYQQLGERMGYSPDTARQSVWQFLNGTNPTLAMLQRLADALGVDARDLL